MIAALLITEPEIFVSPEPRTASERVPVRKFRLPLLVTAEVMPEALRFAMPFCSIDRLAFSFPVSERVNSPLFMLREDWVTDFPSPITNFEPFVIFVVPVPLNPLLRVFVPPIILSVPAFFTEAFVFASLKVMLLRLVTASVLVAFITEPSESAAPVISRLFRVKVVAEF